MTNFDKFAQQDAVIDEFRRFATEKQVNIIPYSPAEGGRGTDAGYDSIFGSAKATRSWLSAHFAAKVSRRYGNGAPRSEDVPDLLSSVEE